MASHRERSKSAILPRHSDVAASYQSWKTQRPQLFRHASQRSAEAMTASSPVQISVIADDQDHMVPLLNAIYDPTATRSVISRVKANDTLGNIREGSAVGVISSAKVDAVTTSYITLRWRYEHGLQSFQEVFHVVDGSEMNGLDAVLRGDIEATPAQVARPVANPMFYGQTGRAGKDERKVREQEMKKKEEAFKKNVAEQRKVVRTTLDGAKGAVRR